MIAHAKEFITTVSGGRYPEDHEEVLRRKESCDACPALVVENDKKYCGGCGCGKWKLAELDTKLRFIELRCPQNRWEWDKRKKKAARWEGAPSRRVSPAFKRKHMRRLTRAEMLKEYKEGRWRP